MKARTWWKVLAAVAVVSLGVLAAIPRAPAEEPSELVKRAIVKWQTDPELKKFSEPVDKLIGQPPSTTPIPPALGVGFENANGYAVHICVETVDPNAYSGEVADLDATVNDVNAMSALSKNLGYKHLKILNSRAEKVEDRATRDNVLGAIRLAASTASGANRDIVLITYSGHGSQVLDDSDDPDEADGKDETWCLYDGMLIDDEVKVEVAKFKAGVRVVFVLDSCHSGSSTKEAQFTAKNYRDLVAKIKEKPGAKVRDLMMEVPGLKRKAATRDIAVGRLKDGVQERQISPEVSAATYAKREAFYKDLATKFNTDPAVRDSQQWAARVITLSACADPQTSLDLGRGNNGLYTRELLRVWQDGKFDGDYNEFQKRVKSGVSTAARETFNHKQEPQLTEDGKTDSFAGQKLFRIK